MMKTMSDDKELIARLRDFEKVTVGDARDAADRIEQLVATNEALEAKLGYYNLLWQAYEGERPVEHLEEAVKNHSAVSDRLAEKLHEVESLLAKAMEALRQIADPISLAQGNVNAEIARATLAEIKSSKAAPPYGLEGESHE
jgi:hypothetical protein